MAYEIFKLRKVDYYVEPTNSYAVQAALTTSYAPIKVLEDSATLEVNLEMVDNKTMMQRVDDFLPKIGTRRRGNFSFTSYLNGTNTSATNGVSQSASPNGDMLKTIMGGEYRMPGMLLNQGVSAGKFVFDGTLGYNAKVGSVIGFVNPTTNQLETSRIAALTTTASMYTASLVHNLTFTPASGSTCYGSANYYLTQDPQNSLQFLIQGANTFDSWVVGGLNGGFGIKTELGALPEIAYKFENGAAWFYGTGSALLPETYTDATPPAFVDGFVSFAARGANSVTPAVSSIINVDTIEITPAIAYVDVTTERGVNNILRKRRNRVTPVATGKLVTYLQDTSIFTARDSATIYFCELQIGNTPGNTVVITMPRIRITKANVAATSTGLAGVEVEFDIMEDTISDNQNPTSITLTDPVRSAISIHFL